MTLASLRKSAMTNVTSILFPVYSANSNMYIELLTNSDTLTSHFFITLTLIMHMLLINQIRYRKNEALGIRYNGFYSVNCVCATCRKHKSFRLAPIFWWKYFVTRFLHDTFNFGVRQRCQKLILHQIIDIYPCIKLINKGLSIFQNLHAWHD